MSRAWILFFGWYHVLVALLLIYLLVMVWPPSVVVEAGGPPRSIQTRGDLDQARRLWLSARDLFAAIGMPHKGQQVQEWLDQLGTPRARRKKK
jgi:hypothetical protein